ncbi:transcriptional regulator, TetR family [Enhydrobacter aerosaccus]|uniref:Transcriptional regulator, TetR family n=1 Tax=Enhydrobacter aerosaccus TaxID=225324 RepID=A0A1T4JLS4_9HYPH|nr:TetR/AcrR family transcriptional regulator [Enhydrobacter aerosaccus]SJZ31101.1 transcriptional regulator, TetR family [Enhydrobacter aerosaccus]
MRRTPAIKQALPTRDRILEAASRCFSKHSYDATGLRDIAADAGVDVAYVHRCFGSKERLFAQALAATARPDRLLTGSSDSVAQALAKQLFAHDTDEDINPLDIIVRSLTNPDAARVLREFIVQDFIGPLATKLEQPALLRAAVIAAFLAGIGILRNVLSIKPLLETEGGQLEKLILGTITTTMHATTTSERGKAPGKRRQ